jgi:hypothetical protein
MKIQVEVKETLIRVVEVEAATEQEALDIVNEDYKDEIIVLDFNDYVSTDIKICERD